ncbi:MAG TPA: hypothetical protein VJ867_08375 [Gemmatimonadaceae bacterium]|nr:hypothetical protein [Gemmatimonadaceae bacterium]
MQCSPRRPSRSDPADRDRAGEHLTVPSLLILGTDAVLTARPATAVQLSHACRAAGFDAVVPATWGDEIIARTVTGELTATDMPLVQCSCPLVARRFGHSAALGTRLLRFVPPPVAAARYLRRLYGGSALRITYAGDCPVPETDAIDSLLSSASLLVMLGERGVTPASQPMEFDSVLPPDRRRHYSEAGGIPCLDALRDLHPCDVIELTGGDVEVDIAQNLLADHRALIDVAIALGCRCSGVVDGVDAARARREVREHEPPRSRAPVLEHDFHVDIRAPEPVTREDDDAMRRSLDEPDDARGVDHEPVLAVAEVSSRRRSPQGTTRAVLGTMPLARGGGGRQLPRAYVARRRSSPKSGMRQSAVRREAPSATPGPRIDRLPLLWIGALVLALSVVVVVALIGN